jgi:PAS domain S-box-containing protein
MSSSKNNPPVAPWLASSPGWLLAIFFGVAYFGCAKISVLFSVKSSPFITFWLPVGLYVGALLLTNYRAWPWLVGAALAANFAFDLPFGTRPGLIVFYYLSNTLVATTAAVLVRKFVSFRPAISSLKELTGLFGLAAIVSSGLGALLGTVGLAVFHESSSIPDSWLVLWADDAMAVILLTPLMLSFCAGSQLQNRMIPRPLKLAEAILLAGGLIAVTWHMFNAGPANLVSPYKFELIPLLLWSGLRFGPRGATAASFAVALMLAHYVSHQLNSQTEGALEVDHQVFLLQAVIIMAAVVAIVPAVVLEERDRTLMTLKESEEKFSKVFRAGPDAYSVSKLDSGELLDVNENYERLFRCRREQVIGRSAVELGFWADPADRARMLEILKGTRSVKNFQAMGRALGGETFPCLISAEIVEIGGLRCAVFVITNITELVQAEKALRESEEKFSKAFRTSPDAMSIKDLGTGHYLDVNHAFEKIYGFKREEVLGRSPLEIGLQENSAADDSKLDTLKSEGVLRHVEINVRSHEGRVLTLLHSAELIELAGRLCELRVSHDITAMRRAEEERTAAVTREQKARIEYTLQLIASQEAERTRIARELHDSLGQNLLLVKNRAQMALLPEFTQGGWQEQVQKIIDLSTLAIDEVRQISRDLHPYQLDHLGFTRAVSSMIDDAAQASGITFDQKIEEVDDVLAGDMAMNFYRVIQECLNNIIKHSRAKNVTVRLERDLHELQLLIADDGCGFIANSVPNNGKGLGLKNIHERMRMLDGTLKLDSQPGHGTRVEAVVPITARPA